MTLPPTPDSEETVILWERPEPALRPAPTPLNRQRIVDAAVAIADRDGLTAVSLRKIGASLEAGPMRLYGYLSTKEELLDLMIDAAYGEIVAMGPITGDWRLMLQTIAHRTRLGCQRHPWFIDLLGGRPHLGPNALTHLEAALAALSTAPGFEDVDVALGALRTVNAYVIGALRSERSELEGGLNKAEWQAVWWPYIERLVATGRFPMLAKVVHTAHHPTADAAFEIGLETVLDGLAARN